MRDLEAQHVGEADAPHALAYARPSEEVPRPRVWQGLGSIVIGSFWLCVGAAFLVAAGVAVTVRDSHRTRHFEAAAIHVKVIDPRFIVDHEVAIDRGHARVEVRLTTAYPVVDRDSRK